MVIKQFCTFYLKKHVFAIDILLVQEIIRHLNITRVPLAPPVIEGLVNLRGQIVTTIDMRRRIGLPPRLADEKTIHVVIRAADGPVSLLVDKIGDMMELPDSEFEPVPESIDEQARDLIKGVYKTAGQLILLLDTIKAITIDSAIPV